MTERTETTVRAPSSTLDDSSETLVYSSGSRRSVTAGLLTDDRVKTLSVTGAELGDTWTFEREDTSAHRLVILNAGPAGGRFIVARAGRASMRFDGADWRAEASPVDRWYSPEDFGAIGDNTADDTAAWQALLALPAVYGTSGPLRIRCAPGRKYRITSTLRLGPTPAAGTTVNSTYIIDGRGASLRGVGASLGATPLLEIGYYDAASATHAQVLYTQIFDLFIQGDAASLGTAGACAVMVQSMQFSLVRNVVIGSFYKGVDTGQDGGNSNAWIDVGVAGAVIGVHLGNGTLQCSNWRWIGSRIQQCTEVGIKAEALAQLIIENVDFSVCTDKSVHLVGCSEVTIRNVYTEALSYASENAAKIFHVEACAAVVFDAVRVNGVGSVTDAQYGIYIEASKAVRIRTCLFTQFQAADVYVDAASVDVTIDADCLRDSSGFASLGGRLRVSDNTPGKLRNQTRTKDLAAQSFSPWPGNQRNAIRAPFDFTDASWTRSSVTISGTTTAPDGVSDAQILEFPNTSGAGDTASISSMSLTSLATSLGEALDGKTLALRYWIKPVATLNVSAAKTSHFRSSIQRQVNDLHSHDEPGVWDGSDDWQFVEHRYAVPSSATDGAVIRAVTFCPPTALNGVSVALWGVQLFALSDAHVSPLAPVWGAFDAQPVEQQADPGILADLSGGAPSRIVVAIPSPAAAPTSAEALREDLAATTIPALRNNIASLTAQVNELRRIFKVYGFARRFSFLDMTGIRLLIDPVLSVDAPTHGAPVSSLTNLAGFGSAFVNTGTSRPTYVAGGFGAADGPCIDFEAANSQRLASSSPSSTFMSASTHVILAVVQYESASSDSGSNAASNDGIVTDSSGGYHALSMRSTGPRATTSVYDGVGFRYVESDVPAAPCLVQAWHAGGSLNLRVNDGPVSSVVCGDINSLAGLLAIGGRGGAHPYFDGKLGLLAVLNEYHPDEIERAREYINDRFGLWTL